MNLLASNNSITDPQLNLIPLLIYRISVFIHRDSRLDLICHDSWSLRPSLIAIDVSSNVFDKRNILIRSW